jgi:succinoglycan biosynthesis protein ExoM
LHALGARFEICEGAQVREDVPDSRQTLRWLLQRKFRSGQSYAVVSSSPKARLILASSAAAKVVFCAGGALIGAWSTERRNFWLLRGALHAGVLGGCLSMAQPEIYGADSGS